VTVRSALQIRPGQLWRSELRHTRILLTEVQPTYVKGVEGVDATGRKGERNVTIPTDALLTRDYTLIGGRR